MNPRRIFPSVLATGAAMIVSAAVASDAWAQAALTSAFSPAHHPTPSATSAGNAYGNPMHGALMRSGGLASQTLQATQAPPQTRDDLQPVPNPYDPPWSTIPPTEVICFDYDTGASGQVNGANLKAVIQALTPGQRLEVGDGTYQINSFFVVDLVGTAAAPIVIAAKEGASPVLTRPDANQNVLNMGSNGPARYLALDGFEITGGSEGLRMLDCENIWINNCHIHDTDDLTLTARSHDTAFLYVTRNEINNPGGTGEGMYLGANNSVFITHDSIIALNHVHDTSGSQGDGIELKQGSYGNWIVENLVHDTDDPCILVYGTDGNALNVVERNMCFNSEDNVIQVQGEAIVIANIAINGGNYAFESFDHQGTSSNLLVAHNTFLNSGRAANLKDWPNRPNMVFANNVAYSEFAEAIFMQFGSNGNTITGNVVLGSVTGTAGGFANGVGLSDFLNASFDASALDVRPALAGALIGAADPLWVIAEDFFGDPLIAPFEAGAVDG